MSARESLVGRRYGSLTVLCEDGHDPHGHILWKCSCDCGGTRSVTTSKLNSGGATSCGCGAWRGGALSDTRSDPGWVADNVSRDAYSNSTSGVRGVLFEKACGKWAAYISARGKRRFLGRYPSLDDAIAARRRAEEELADEAARESASGDA